MNYYPTGYRIEPRIPTSSARWCGKLRIELEMPGKGVTTVSVIDPGAFRPAGCQMKGAFCEAGASRSRSPAGC